MIYHPQSPAYGKEQVNRPYDGGIGRRQLHIHGFTSFYRVVRFSLIIRSGRNLGEFHQKWKRTKDKVESQKCIALYKPFYALAF